MNVKYQADQWLIGNACWIAVADLQEQVPVFLNAVEMTCPSFWDGLQYRTLSWQELVSGSVAERVPECPMKSKWKADALFSELLVPTDLISCKFLTGKMFYVYFKK